MEYKRRKKMARCIKTKVVGEKVVGEKKGEKEGKNVVGEEVVEESLQLMPTTTPH